MCACVHVFLECVSTRGEKTPVAHCDGKNRIREELWKSSGRLQSGRLKELNSDWMFAQEF